VWGNACEVVLITYAAALNLVIAKLAITHKPDCITFLAMNLGFVLTHRSESPDDRTISYSLPIPLFSPQMLHSFTIYHMSNMLSTVPEAFAHLLDMFKLRFYNLYGPGWQGPIMPEQSVEMMLQVVDSVDVERSREFPDIMVINIMVINIMVINIMVINIMAISGGPEIESLLQTWRS
jgi:hypothetical protein